VKCKFDSGRFMANLKAVRKHKKANFQGGGWRVMKDRVTGGKRAGG